MEMNCGKPTCRRELENRLVGEKKPHTFGIGSIVNLKPYFCFFLLDAHEIFKGNGISN